MLRITTPLFYVNNKPHIGHLYTILYADAIKIWKSHTVKAELLTGLVSFFHSLPNNFIQK